MHPGGHGDAVQVIIKVYERVGKKLQMAMVSQV
jgi:hypothetical protein